MNTDADSSIFTSCFALFLYDLFDQVREWAQGKRDEWAAFIRSFQDSESGYFLPAAYQGSLNTKAVHQCTAFCLSALRILEKFPKYDLSFLSQWNTPEKMYGYLENSGCFKGAPGSGNTAMFVAIFLTYQYERVTDVSLLELMENWFDFHDKAQNPSSGFWGDSSRQRYFSGFQNAFHQFVIYHYWNRDVQFHEKIVDAVMKLQDRDGFFAPIAGGGGCWDLDAADILIRCGYQKGYRNRDIRHALTRLFEAVLKSQNDDGGFCESRKRPSSIIKVFSCRNIKTILSGHRPDVSYWRLRASLSNARSSREKIYTHWTEGGRFWHQSDMWDTWFRCLTLAEIDTILNLSTGDGGEGWNFQKCIGLGHFET
jgi:prenyltransferase beta subunit